MEETWEDSIELKDNGSVVITLDGKSYNCRRPTGGEYLQLMEKAIEMAEKVTDALGLDDENKKFTADDQLESTKISFRLASEWFHLLLTLLANPAYDGKPEDLPPWVLSDLSGQLINTHWIKVPLVRPGR